MKNNAKFKIFFSIIIVIITVIGLTFFLNKRHQLSASENITNADNAKIWVISDPHLIDDTLHDNGKRFQILEGSAASKDLKYMTTSLQKLVKKAQKEQPDAIIITGDVTFNGEEISAKKIAKIFSKLDPKKTRLLVIPGNHDIYDGWARKYHKSGESYTKQISPEAWEQIFKTSYEGASSIDSNSLSYTINLNRQYELVMLDSNYYGGTESTAAPHTRGGLNEKTLSWLDQQLQKAKTAGRQPIIFMHHNLYDHAGDNRTGYVLDNVDQLRKILKKYQVKLLFSGHIHIHDVMKDPTGQLPTIEVLNGSYAVSDHTYSEVKLSPKQIIFHKKVFDIKPYLSASETKNPDLNNYQKYLKQLFMDDTKAIIYDQMFYRFKNEPQKLDQIASAFALVNWYFFTGNDDLSNAEINKLLATPGFKLLLQEKVMTKDEIIHRLQDTNQNDNYFVINN